MSAAGYRIVDEPAPSTLSHLAVNPFWIFLGGLLGGSWLAWPWYVLNGQVIGSATRWRELALVVGSALGTFALSLTIVILYRQGVVAEAHVKYALVLLQGFKLVFLYLLHTTQSRGFELFEHFGGQARSGVWVIPVAFLLRRPVITAFEADLWVLLVS